VAPFARRNYYREAVKRLRKLARKFHLAWGGAGEAQRRSYRILCNSPVPEKPLAIASGLGAPGRNGLVITPEAGSRVIIAAMTLPFALEGDGPLSGKPFPLCGGCSPVAPCIRACPTGALRGDGSIARERCIQWYASGGDIQAGSGRGVPPEVAAKWGRRLYGCTCCQDACPHNRGPLSGAATEEGVLPALLDGGELLSLDDESLKARFRGTALGMAWLSAETIRRSVRLALRGY
jgi:epoxyqueuosine reductase